MKYRIIEGTYEHCNGYTCHQRRGYIAQRQVMLFWCIPIWWPVGDWSPDILDCRSDIDRHQRTIAPSMVVSEFEA